MNSNRRTLGARLACAMVLSGAVPLISAATLMLGCGASNDHASTENGAGDVSVVALALSAADVSKVTVTVTGPAGGALASPLAVDLQRSGSLWAGFLSRIPAGSGYTFTLRASDGNSNVLYTGTVAPVTIAKNQTAQVVITGQQVDAPAAFRNAAPVIDALVVSSTTVAPGERVSLSTSAHDPNPGDNIRYAWTASSGAFSSPSAGSTEWTAPATAGTYPLTLTVMDQAGATGTVQVSVVVADKNSKGSAAITVTLNTWPVVTNVVGTPNHLIKGAATLLTAQASDADGDSLTYAWTSNCLGTFSSTQLPTPSFTLDRSATATSCTLSVAVSDGHGGTTTGSLVLPVGQPPVLVAPAVTLATQSAQSVGATDQVTLRVEATDPQGLALSFAWSATGGTISKQNDSAGQSQIVWSPPAVAAPSWSITTLVTDSAGISTPYTFTLRAASCFGTQAPASQPWRFVVMSDTQWTVADDGKNPNSVAVDIINQLNAQFIAQKVQFVVAAGDLTDKGTRAALDTRAEFAQALYNAGIGFFPLRGNHESSKTAAAEFTRVFPQTSTGLQNATPADAFIPHIDDISTHPVAPAGSPFLVGSSFSSPTAALNGLSYAFDYGNARFVLLDQFTPAVGSASTIDAQQAWISSTLSGRPAGTHAFVFGHKGILTEDHEDTLFGSDPSKDPAGQDAFITALAQNGVRYYMGGHDHMHNRAIVTTTDGTTASVQDITLASDSSKFYTPANPSNDDKYNVPAFGHKRETPIAQELDTLGYYVVIVADSRVTVDFYSAPANPVAGNIDTTPSLNFTQRESFGYGLNGKEFVIPAGGSYTVVQDSYAGTTVRILGGTHANAGLDASGRPLARAVDTAWTDATCATASAVLTLSVTGTLGTGQTDAYALSMTYDPTAADTAQIVNGGFGIGTKNASGDWINAVDKNFRGTKTFVQGPWQPSYTAGTYGVDAATNTAWAVVDFSGDFAVTGFGTAQPISQATDGRIGLVR